MTTETDFPNQIYVVFNSSGVDFSTEIRQVAMDHASGNAGEFPENGPWRVQAYALLRASTYRASTYHVFNGCKLVSSHEDINAAKDYRDKMRRILPKFGPWRVLRVLRVLPDSGENRPWPEQCPRTGKFHEMLTGDWTVKDDMKEDEDDNWN